MNGIEDTTAKQVFSDNINTNTSNICIFSSVMKHKCLELGKVVLFVRMPLWYISGGLLFQEKLGEFTGHEEFRTVRHDQHLNNDGQKTGQAEVAQSGH